MKMKGAELKKNQKLKTSGNVRFLPDFSRGTWGFYPTLVGVLGTLVPLFSSPLAAKAAQPQLKLGRNQKPRASHRLLKILEKKKARKFLILKRAL